MADIEIIEFKPPSSSTNCLHLIQIEAGDLEETRIADILHQHFSQFGLIFNVNVSRAEETGDFYSYIRYYSTRAACRARRSTDRKMTLSGIQFRLSKGSSSSQPCNLPLSRQKCEHLANYYLGFNGWSSQVLYHRKEDIDPGTLTHVTVVKLSFPKEGLECEGAGRADADKNMGDVRENYRVMADLGKRSKGEAIQAAWSKVVLVVVDGSKVSVEINTTTQDKFFYDPTWEDPEVVVENAEYMSRSDDINDENKFPE